MLFRPEQEHGFSGEDDVVVPMSCWHGYVNDSLRPKQPAFPHAEDHLVIAAAAGGINLRVPVQHGRDSEGIPDAVAIPGSLAGSNCKDRGHSRKWSGSPEFSSLLQDESMGLRQALKRGSDFTHRGGKRCGHLRYCRRSALADEMSIDRLAQMSVVGFRALVWGGHRVCLD
jgi:hypothetical protein